MPTQWHNCQALLMSALARTLWPSSAHLLRSKRWEHPSLPRCSKLKGKPFCSRATLGFHPMMAALSI